MAPLSTSYGLGLRKQECPFEFLRHFASASQTTKGFVILQLETLLCDPPFAKQNAGRSTFRIRTLSDGFDLSPMHYTTACSRFQVMGGSRVMRDFAVLAALVWQRFSVSFICGSLSGSATSSYCWVYACAVEHSAIWNASQGAILWLLLNGRTFLCFHLKGTHKQDSQLCAGHPHATDMEFITFSLFL